MQWLHVLTVDVAGHAQSAWWTVWSDATVMFTVDGHIKTAEQRTIVQQYDDWYTDCWWVGCYIWYSEEWPGWAVAPPSTLLAVPKVTAYPSVASVPTSYYLMWHYNQLPLNSRGLRMYVCMCVGFILWRARRVLENRQNMDDDRMGQLEISLKEAQDNATEADKKYEEVSLTAKFNLYSTIFGVCRWLQHWVSQAHFCNIFFHFFPDHFQHMHQERALLCVH